MSEFQEISLHGWDNVKNIYNTFSLTYVYYNKWISSSVKQMFKKHALQLLKISLTTDTIHVWKCASLLTGFWIKQKFQDTSLHHTSLTPWEGRWSHCLLLKEKITDFLGYVGGAKVKNSFACKNEGVFIAKGETDPYGYLTTLTTVWIPWIFEFTWLLIQQVGLLGFHVTLHWFDNMAHSGDVDNMTYDMTWHECAGTFVLLLECMSSCNAAVDGCLHGVLQLHLCMARCVESSMFVGSLDVYLAHCFLLVCWKAWKARLFTKGACSFIRPSVSTSCMSAHSSIGENIFSWSSVCKNISSHASFVYLLVNLSFCMCSLSSSHSSSRHVCWCTYTCTHSWRDEIKSKKLLVYHDTWSFWM